MVCVHTAKTELALKVDVGGGIEVFVDLQGKDVYVSPYPTITIGLFMW